MTKLTWSTVTCTSTFNLAHASPEKSTTMTRFSYITCIVAVLALLLATGQGFVVRNQPFLSARTSPLSTASEGDESSSDEAQPSSFPQQPPSEERLDPLIASLTRNDQVESSSVQAPLLGEIPIDGSLVVLLPAAIIGVVGFAMSINIAMNSQDAIVDSLNQLSEDAAAAAVAKTNLAAPLDGGCRGICSDQAQELEGLKTFMQGLGK